MSASARDLERAFQVRFVRVQKAEQKGKDIHYALIVPNGGFERIPLGAERR
jgi:hypothetical protein